MNYLQMIGCQSQVLDKFAKEIKSGYEYQIHHNRIPFKVVLREYAAWINRKKEKNISVIQYMIDRIEVISGDIVATKTIRKIASLLQSKK